MTNDVVNTEMDQFDPMRADPNNFIVETYNELILNRDILKEVRQEKKDALDEDDNILAILNQIDELKQLIKPLSEKLKVAKEEFKVKHVKLFEKELNHKRKDEELKWKVAKAYAIKEANNDKTPILINNWKKELIINLTPRVTKQKVL